MRDCTVPREYRTEAQSATDLEPESPRSLAARPACDGFHHAAILRRHVVEVRRDAVLDHPPLGAVLVRCNRLEAGSRARPYGEQLARVVPDAVRLAVLAETFRRASSSLWESLHVHNYVISQNA